MTKTKQIIQHLLQGKKLTSLGVALSIGTTKLPNRISEIEEKIGFNFKRVERENKKTNSRYYEYSLPDKITAKNKLKLIELFKQTK